MSGSYGLIDPSDEHDPSDHKSDPEKQNPEPQALWVGAVVVEPGPTANSFVEHTMSRRRLCIQRSFMDLDRNRRASVGLIQTREAPVREPPPVTGIAAQERRVRYRLRLHVISALRAQCLCPDRDASGITDRPRQ